MRVRVLGLGQSLNKHLLSLLCAQQSPRHWDHVWEQTVLNLPSRHSSAGAMEMQVGEVTFSAAQKPHHQPPWELRRLLEGRKVSRALCPVRVGSAASVGRNHQDIAQPVENRHQQTGPRLSPARCPQQPLQGGPAHGPQILGHTEAGLVGASIVQGEETWKNMGNAKMYS